MEKEKSRVVILYNEEDIKRGAEIWTDTGWRRNRRRAWSPLIILLISFALAAVVLACGMIYESANGVLLFRDAVGAFGDFDDEVGVNMYSFGEVIHIGAALLWVAFVFFVMFAASKRFGGAKGIAQKRFEGEMMRRKSGFLPRELTFEENGVRTKGRSADFVIGFDEIERAYELSDGIFLQMENTQYLWIPARFFDAESAEGARNTLKDAFGKKFIIKETLVLPERTERPEKEDPIAPEGDALIEFDINAKKGNFIQSGFKGLGVKRLLFILVALVLFVIAGFVLSLNVKSMIKVNPDRTVWDYILRTLMGIIPMIALFGAGISILKNNVGIIFKNAGRSLKWNGSGAMYENIIVRECPSGKSIMPWDKVDVSTMTREGLYIVSNEVGFTLIPAKEVHKRGEKLIDIVNEQMQKHHHHDDDCCCGECAHDENDHDEHEHSENGQ